ncbi:MAG TPA: TonB-dependent receptor [Asticcacaulis sp.]|nr:TonB-dependent receptor [Asticcacaulis sp.]
MPRLTFRHVLPPVGIVSLLALMAAGSTLAQTQNQPTKKPQNATAKADAPTSGAGDSAAAAEVPTTVTVRAQKPAIQHKADRDVYDVTQDPDAATGSAADVMNNIPAVTVDQDGSVALRGDTNVQIYINGKPSSQMQGDDRGPALQSLSADDIDSVEVMTNPSAAFGADTGGGIINIVLKKGKHIKPNTSFNIAMGDAGRYQFGFRSGTNIGRLTLNGGVNLRSDARKNGSHSDRQRIDPDTGDVRASSQDSQSRNRTQNISANLHADYDATDYDTVSAELHVSRRTQEGYSANEYRYFDDAGAVSSAYAQLGDQRGPSDHASASLSWDHRGRDNPDNDFKLEIKHSESTPEHESDYRQIYHQPLKPDAFYATRSRTRNVNDDFSGDWKRVFGGGQQVQAGWDVQHTQSDAWNYRSMNHAEGEAEVANPNYTNQFNVDQTISAGYVTWQKTLGKFSAQVGLRGEKLDETLDQVTSGIEAHVDQVSWNPSLFLLYTINDKDGLRASYGHKIVRPGANLLNPFLRYGDAQNVSSGNPYLLPEQVETWELEYDHTTRPFNASATLFYKTVTDNFSRASDYLPGSSDVLLTTNINDGSRKNVGLQYSLNGQGDVLRYGLNGVLGWSSQDSTDYVTHAPVHRESGNSSARLYARWSPDKKNTLGLFVRWRGRQLLSQGYRDGSTSLNLSYQYQIVPNKVQVTMNARDILASEGGRSVTQTSTVYNVVDRYDYGATFMLALRYTFGAPRDPQPDQDRRRDNQGPMRQRSDSF